MNDGQVVLAHAVGIRADLPVDLYLVLIAGALAVTVSFGALSALWRTPRLSAESAGRALPGVPSGEVLLLLGRALALLVALFVVVVALLGPPEVIFNLAPYALYLTFWVGIVPASLLLGPVVKQLSPLRTVYRGLARIAGPAPAEGHADRLGLYPAAALLLAFTWIELVYPNRAVPQTVGALILAYAVGQIVAALWYGESWFERGEAFEVWGSLLARLSPWGRRADGTRVMRNPLDNADGTPLGRGTAAVAVVMIGSTGFDGVTRALWWQSRINTSTNLTLVSTIGLFTVVAVVAALYYGATVVAGRLGGFRRTPEAFAFSLIPIAAGYAVAHYFSLFLIEGQLTFILANNPFGVDGVDLFGSYRNAVDLTVVSPGVIAGVQIAAIIAGHVVGVVLAHDRAVKLATLAVGTAPVSRVDVEADERAAGGAREPGALTTWVRPPAVAAHVTARTSQYPLLVVMVAITVGGLALLLG